ncbi:hypothetical protein FTX61_15585 [Nitriliruptoraceae bacterium ZYF776]|nr:hypothetical protein [Profundirhabdus halotolerans]
MPSRSCSGTRASPRPRSTPWSAEPRCARCTSGLIPAPSTLGRLEPSTRTVAAARVPPRRRPRIRTVAALDQDTLARFRGELETDRRHQLDQLEEFGADPYSEDVDQLDLGTDGFADSAQATEQRSEVLGLIETSRQRLHAIDEALGRVEDGTYGTCASCGDAIALERLEARPLSIRCVACAEAGR